jgi:hypothetical protein
MDSQERNAYVSLHFKAKITPSFFMTQPNFIEDKEPSRTEPKINTRMRIENLYLPFPEVADNHDNYTMYNPEMTV